jgi:hypothetical protein
MPTPGGPDAPAPISRAAALREGALLSENIDAVSTKRIA